MKKMRNSFRRRCFRTLTTSAGREKRSVEGEKKGTFFSRFARQSLRAGSPVILKIRFPRMKLQSRTHVCVWKGDTPYLNVSSSLQTQDLRPPDRGLRLVFGNCYLVEVHLRAKTTGRDLPGKIKKIGDLGNDKYTRFVLWKTVRTAEPIPLNTFGRFQGKMAALRRSRRNTESGAIRAADRRSHYRQHGRSLTRSAPQNTPDRLFLESSPALSPRGTVSAPLKRARPERTHGAKGSPFPPPSRGPRAWPRQQGREETSASAEASRTG